MIRSSRQIMPGVSVISDSRTAAIIVAAKHVHRRARHRRSGAQTPCRTGCEDKESVFNSAGQRHTTTVKAVCAQMMTPVHLTGHLVVTKLRCFKCMMRTPHAPPGTGGMFLLNGHVLSPHNRPALNKRSGKIPETDSGWQIYAGLYTPHPAPQRFHRCHSGLTSLSLTV